MVLVLVLIRTVKGREVHYIQCSFASSNDSAFVVRCKHLSDFGTHLGSPKAPAASVSTGVLDPQGTLGLCKVDSTSEDMHK